VIFDFVNKLRAKPRELEILGDGSQKKSYLHVEDGIRGIFLALDKMTTLKNVINLGHVEYMNVKNLAEIVCEELGLSDVAYRFTGGPRGWLGDSPFVHLDISKLQSIGFQPRISIEEGVRRTAKYLVNNPWILASRHS
jgi:UDP-glucose 4-epimerase